MQNNDITLIRDFYQRYKKLSCDSGYALVYDTLTLIREYIPCKEIGISIAKAEHEDPQNIRPATIPLSVATPLMGRTQGLFYGMLSHIDFAKRTAANMIGKIIDGDRVEAISFYATDDARDTQSVIHRFYTDLVNVSDVVMTAGLIERHQFYQSPLTQGYYVAYSCMARDNGQTFRSREKQLFALFFDIFLEDFRKKISCPENSPFLPHLTAEKTDVSKIEAIFDTGLKLKPRELATIKACFDLKQSQRKVTRSSIAGYLHLQDRDNCSDAELRKALDKVDYDFKKIKNVLLKDFEHDSSEHYNQLNEAFSLEHITDIFQAYAYFGLYPHIPKGKDQLISYLSNRLGHYR